MHVNRHSRSGDSVPPPPSRSSHDDVSWSAAPIQAVGRLLTQRLVVHREGMRIYVLPERLPERRRRAASTASPPRQTLLHDFTQLRELLTLLLGARRSMPHLIRVEQALASDGSQGLMKVSLPVLQSALKQLEALVDGFAGMSLAELRQQLETAIKSQQQKRADEIEVSEATFSQFEELQDGWPPTLPLRRA